MGPDFLDIVQARDVGLGGIGVWVSHGFAGCDTSDSVDLIVSLPSQKPFLTRGRIRHQSYESGGNFFGVSFIDLAPAHRRLLQDYIEEHLSRGS